MWYNILKWLWLLATVFYFVEGNYGKAVFCLILFILFQSGLWRK